MKLGERKFYRRKEDEDLLIKIKSILNRRPSYGYRRITYMLNKERLEKDLPILNKKRIYRIMKMNSLIVEKYSGVKRRENRTGKIMTLKSNTRWCSDCFEIRCFNGEKVYVTFALDTCDREILAFKAKGKPIIIRDIQELMYNSVKYRFGDYKTDRPIQWLTDRGAIYRSEETQSFGRRLGLRPCMTMPYSPQSNGMAEAFVGTFKRDYVYNFDCKDARTVLKNIKSWFEDYNSNAPHSALKMMSPRDFIKRNQV